MKKIQETLGLHAGSYDAYFICDPGFRSRTPGNSNHKECRDDQYRTYVSQLETVSNADGYKLRIYNCNTKKSASKIFWKVQRQLFHKKECQYCLSCICMELQMGKRTENIQY